jgi:hypothetical protein
MVETIIVYGLVAVAAAFVAKRFWPRRRRAQCGSGDCACGK